MAQPKMGNEKIMLQVCAEFIWGNKAQVFVDYSGASVSFAKIALLLGCKGLVFCHNAAHVKYAKGISKNKLLSFFLYKQINNNMIITSAF